MVRISKKQIEVLAKKHKIDLSVISVDTLVIGTKVELEHGKHYSKHNKDTNVIGTNIELAFKIVLGHLVEFPNYYHYLTQMESKLDAYWSKRKKPSIFLE
jgi:hypothetical protein